MLSSHYAEVGGARVHYVREGTGPHPVLLLPGALGSAVSDFTPQLEGLSKVYRAYNTLMGPKKVLLKIRKKVSSLVTMMLQALVKLKKVKWF